MKAARNAVAFAVNGTNLNFSIHIDGIALGPYYNPTTGDVNLNNQGVYNPDQNYERRVFYSPLSSFHLYSLPASVLRNPELVRQSSPREILEAVTDHGLKISQVDGMTMDNYGILYYGLLRNHAVARWDSYRPFSYDNQQIIAKDDTHIQWTDGMFLINILNISEIFKLTFPQAWDSMKMDTCTWLSIDSLILLLVVWIPMKLTLEF